MVFSGDSGGHATAGMASLSDGTPSGNSAYLDRYLQAELGLTGSRNSLEKQLSDIRCCQLRPSEGETLSVQDGMIEEDFW